MTVGGDSVCACNSDADSRRTRLRGRRLHLPLRHDHARLSPPRLPSACRSTLNAMALAGGTWSGALREQPGRHRGGVRRHRVFDGEGGDLRRQRQQLRRAVRRDVPRRRRQRVRGERRHLLESARRARAATTSALPSPRTVLRHRQVRVLEPGSPERGLRRRHVRHQRRAVPDRRELQRLRRRLQRRGRRLRRERPVLVLQVRMHPPARGVQRARRRL